MQWELSWNANVQRLYLCSQSKKNEWSYSLKQHGLIFLSCAIICGCDQDDIIRSLQSRLDTICDEADEDLGPTDDGIREASNDSLSEKPVSQLGLYLLKRI